MHHTAGRVRCAWSGERSDRLIELAVPSVDRIGRHRGSTTVHVLPEHEAALRAHLDLGRRYGSRFLIGMVVLGLFAFGAAMAPAFDRSLEPVAIPVAGLLIGLMGLLIIALPFTTPETSAFFGLRRSIRIARVLGALTLILGAWIAIAG
jgi:hypothetical protein